MPVGTYSLEVKADGFPNSQTRDLRASIGQVIRIEIVLGSNDVLSSSLHATGTSVVETSNTQLGVVMGDLEVANLPLKSRDTFELLQLQPGVQSTLGADLFFGGDQPGVVSVNGGRARSNNYNVNGGHSGDQFINAPSIQPSPDSISEFRVISHNYDAELGRNSGSVINVITKSGSNTLHGSIYEYFRNKVLNARGYFDPETPDFKQNEFGGILGGAIRRDKTFFFSSYEGRRLRQGITSDACDCAHAAGARRRLLGRSGFHRRTERRCGRDETWQPSRMHLGGRGEWRSCDSSGYSVRQHFPWKRHSSERASTRRQPI